jgi:pyruvate dehydrogenase E2 component (dihydrolipoamide acetyltransferase)
LATQNNLDVGMIQGSGPHGRVVKMDIERALKQGPSKSARVSEGPAYNEISLNTMRKVIAKRLTEAKQQIPHFYLTVDCQIDALLNLRKEINVLMEEQKVSVNDLIIRACALALVKVPEANATWHDTFIRQYRHADVAVAVAIDGGLITPVIQHADTKSIRELSAEMRVLAEKARSGKLAPEEYQGGTFTISNLGMYGIKHFSAILNPPQACILAVGAGEARPIVVEGNIKVATIMTCTLSVDHRAVDGAIGSRFLKVFKEHIENPLALLQII